ILNSQGAERLMGKGDMLFLPFGASHPFRIQGCFISSDEIEAVCEFVKKQGAPGYDQAVLDKVNKASESIGKSAKKPGAENAFGDDPLLNEAIDAIMEMKMASTSGLQRRLKVGYARAGRLIDLMEEKGIVGPFQGSKPRQILISEQAWQEMKMNREG
ncbi:MAG: DNA translocase FtsK, partial [Clostridia bacterium]|nr:DNA translocase FtsK [Clostridia bacterium]